DHLAFFAEVVHQREDSDTAQVKLPERDSLPVRAPAKTVVQVQFFFVHPVGDALAHKIVAVMGEALDGAVALSAPEVFDVYLVDLNVRTLGRIGIEFGIHQAGLGRISAQLLELAGRTVEKPVVSARVGAPYAASIRENQDALVVLRPTESRDLE